MTKSSRKTKIIFAFACIYFLWGSTYLFVKFGLETIPPFMLAGLRFILAGGGLFLFERLRGEKNPTGKQWLNAYVIGFFMLLIGNGFMTYAQLRVPSGLTALLLCTTPIWFLIFEWIKPNGEKPKLWVLAGILLGFLGIGLLISPDKQGSAHVDLLGAVILILCSISWVIGSLFSRKMDIPKSPFMTTSIQMIAGATLMIAVSGIKGEFYGLDVFTFSSRSILSVLYLAVFGSLLAFSSYIWLMRTLPPALVSTNAFVNPAIAVFVGWMFGGEEITLKIILATVIIIFAVIIIAINNLKQSGTHKITISSSDCEPIEDSMVEKNNFK